jgi:circadian clock protein KaiC
MTTPPPLPVEELREGAGRAGPDGARNRVPTGVPGLDEILHGGLVRGRTYLVRGGPGAGKTTLGLHFLTAEGGPALFISLGEPEEQLRANASLRGFDLAEVAFLDLSPSRDFFAEVETYDIFSPAEVEREPTTERIVARVEEVKPERVFLDAMTQFRYLATDAFQFRRQVLSFLRFLVEAGATVVFASEGTEANPDDDLQFMADGVIDLCATPDARSVEVTKLRGSGFEPGRHGLRLTDRGLEVFPRLAPGTHGREFTAEAVSSGVPELDELLSGGIERGTVTIVSGPSGVGKSTLALQFMKEAAGRGERSVAYLFDEGIDTLTARCRAVGIPVDAMVARGTLSLVPVEPLRFGPDEFAAEVRRAVETEGARIVLIDSIAGYELCVRGEDLVGHVHALSRYLKNMGVTAILVHEVEAVAGGFRITDVGTSYLADNVVFLRYLELGGELRKAIGVLKKRTSDFEKALRELEITRYGIKVGRPLSDLRGILTGTPDAVARPGPG